MASFRRNIVGLESTKINGYGNVHVCVNSYLIVTYESLGMQSKVIKQPSYRALKFFYKVLYKIVLSAGRL